jgi:hypothetical protein
LGRLHLFPQKQAAPSVSAKPNMNAAIQGERIEPGMFGAGPDYSQAKAKSCFLAFSV